MKKILLSILSLVVAFSANSQTLSGSLKVKPAADEVGTIINTPKPAFETKKTRGITRRYNYVEGLDIVDNGGQGGYFATAAFPPIWQDSTIQQLFNTGYGAINYTSVGHTIDPSVPFWNTLDFAGETHINPTDPYTLDSVIFFGAYVTPNLTGAVAGDKITISVVLSSNNQGRQRTFNQTAAAWVVPYLGNAGSADTSLTAYIPASDSVAKIAGDLPANRLTWDYVFTNADTGTTIKRWAFALPSALNVPPGSSIAASMTFFSNDTWVNNVDSVGFEMGSKAHVRPRFFAETASGAMQYRNNSELGYNNRNNSCLMFAASPGIGYVSSVVIEGINQPTFRNEHLDVDFVITCPTCLSIGIDDFSKDVDNLQVYPNPASSVANVAFTAKKNLANVYTEILNMNGQVIVTEQIGNISNGQAINKQLNVANLSAGTYFVRFNADNENSFMARLLVK